MCHFSVCLLTDHNILTCKMVLGAKVARHVIITVSIVIVAV